MIGYEIDEQTMQKVLNKTGFPKREALWAPWLATEAGLVLLRLAELSIWSRSYGDWAVHKNPLGYYVWQYKHSCVPLLAYTEDLYRPPKIKEAGVGRELIEDEKGIVIDEYIVTVRPGIYALYIGDDKIAEKRITKRQLKELFGYALPRMALLYPEHQQVKALFGYYVIVPVSAPLRGKTRLALQQYLAEQARKWLDNLG